MKLVFLGPRDHEYHVALKNSHGHNAACALMPDGWALQAHRNLTVGLQNGPCPHGTWINATSEHLAAEAKADRQKAGEE